MKKGTATNPAAPNGLYLYYLNCCLHLEREKAASREARLLLKTHSEFAVGFYTRDADRQMILDDAAYAKDLLLKNMQRNQMNTHTAHKSWFSDTRYSRQPQGFAPDPRNASGRSLVHSGPSTSLILQCNQMVNRAPLLEKMWCRFSNNLASRAYEQRLCAWCITYS